MTHPLFIIDWLSFTFPAAGQGGLASIQVEQSIRQSMEESLPFAVFELLMKHEVERGPGRRPYSIGLRGPGNIYTIFGAPGNGYLLFELTGQGCEWLRQLGELENLIKAVQDRVTRIDLAIDLRTDCNPRTFVDEGVSDRFVSFGDFESSTGHTIYVGSRKSDLYARVYRYTEPHPRAKFLRVEHVFKKDRAKSFCKYMLEHAPLKAAQAAVDIFAWKSPEIAIFEGTAPSMTVTRQAVTMGKTERWLISQAAPAFKKLCEAEQIKNPEEWLREHFLTGLGSGQE